MGLHEIDVIYDNGEEAQLVGRLASYGVNTVFEYDDTWMKHRIELAPFKLPTHALMHNLDRRDNVQHTFGLFADSLPDGWGMLIMDRSFKKRGIDKKDISIIDRLAFLGNHAMGILCYRPPLGNNNTGVPEAVSVGELAREAYELYLGRIEDAGNLLSLIGGSPGGARPKALIGISDNKESFVSGVDRLP